MNVYLRITLGIVITILLFHLCILMGIIPYEYTWGGKLKTDQEMYAFEGASLLINLFFGWVLMMKGKVIPQTFSEKAINIILWVFFGLFSLNTIGNIFAETTFEKGMTLVTVSLAFLLFKILRSK